MIEILLPELLLGYAQLLIVIPSAQFAQNPVLCVRAYFSKLAFPNQALSLYRIRSLPKPSSFVTKFLY